MIFRLDGCELRPVGRPFATSADGGVRAAHRDEATSAASPGIAWAV